MEEKCMIIDGIRCAFTDEHNVLDVAHNNGIEIPNLCYCEGLAPYGACRMCIVEKEDGLVDTSCSMKPEEGLVVYTNTPKVQRSRKLILELLLGSHRTECTVCEKASTCRLLEYSMRYREKTARADNRHTVPPVDDSSVCVVRDPSKCVLCTKCVRVCDEIQGVKALAYYRLGSNSYVAPVQNKALVDTDCVGCGQCVSVCPTGALVVKSQIDRFWEMVHDRHHKTVVQVAPAVRVGLAEAFGMPQGTPVMGKLVTALKRIGVDVVYDTNMAADLTIMEESKEFLERLESGEKMPLFTSCCPGWIQYAEHKHPELLPQISTCGSPMEMMGALIRKQFRKERVHSVAIMPCTAKKYECQREQLEKDGVPVVDLVITTVELIRILKESLLHFEELPETETDNPLGTYSGGGALFGVTGGVTEAVIRRVLADDSPDTLQTIAQCGVRGLRGTKIFEVKSGRRTLRIGVVSGLKNAELLIKRIQAGSLKLDFVEVMACPNGCIGGGGQPETSNRGKQRRSVGIFQTDDDSSYKLPQQNPALDYVYNTLLEGRAHELLHVNYVD